MGSGECKGSGRAEPRRAAGRRRGSGAPRFESCHVIMIRPAAARRCPPCHESDCHESRIRIPRRDSGWTPTLRPGSARRATAVGLLPVQGSTRSSHFCKEGGRAALQTVDRLMRRWALACRVQRRQLLQADIPGERRVRVWGVPWWAVVRLGWTGWCAAPMPSYCAESVGVLGPRV